MTVELVSGNGNWMGNILGTATLNIWRKNAPCWGFKYVPPGDSWRQYHCRMKQVVATGGGEPRTSRFHFRRPGAYRGIT